MSAILIQNVILIIAVMVAWYQINTHRKIEKLKISMDILKNLDRMNQHSQTILAKIDNQKDPIQGENLAYQYYQAKGKKQDETLLQQTIDLIQYLNDLEDISIGIKQGIYDEETIKMSIESRVIRTYNTSKSFINKAREYQDDKSILYNFEILAIKWEKNKPNTNTN